MGFIRLKTTPWPRREQSSSAAAFFGTCTPNLPTKIVPTKIC